MNIIISMVSARKHLTLTCESSFATNWKFKVKRKITILEMLLKMLKNLDKLTIENYKWRNSFLTDLLTASEFFSVWMFLTFVSFITNHGFFVTCLENRVYDDVLWRHDDFKDDIGIFLLKFYFLFRGGRGRGEGGRPTSEGRGLKDRGLRPRVKGWRKPRPPKIIWRKSKADIVNYWSQKFRSKFFCEFLYFDDDDNTEDPRVTEKN